MRNVFTTVGWVGVLVIATIATLQMPIAAQETATGRKVTTRVTPVYSEVARRAALTGTVKMVVTVSPNGTVTSVRTVGGNPVLASAAETAVKAWIYESATAESTEVAAIIFALK